MTDDRLIHTTATLERTQVESGSSAVNKLLGTRQAYLWDRRPGLERSRLAAATVQMEELIMAQPQEEAGRPQRARRGTKRWAEEYVVCEGGSKRGRKGQSQEPPPPQEEQQEQQGQEQEGQAAVAAAKAAGQWIVGDVVGGVAGGGGELAAAPAKMVPPTFAEVCCIYIYVLSYDMDGGCLRTDALYTYV